MHPSLTSFLTCIRQKYASEMTAAVKYDSDVDNTVEVLLTGLKNIIYLPFDCLDSHSMCAIDTTDEGINNEQHYDDSSIASNQESISDTFSQSGHSVACSIANESQATIFGLKQKAPRPPVRGRRKRRIFRI